MAATAAETLLEPVVATRVMRALTDEGAYESALAFGAASADARFREACAPAMRRARDELQGQEATRVMRVYYSAWIWAPTPGLMKHAARLMLAEAIRRRGTLRARGAVWLRRARQVARETAVACAPEAVAEWDYYERRLGCAWITGSAEHGDGPCGGGAADARAELLGVAA